ncbi:MAG: peptidylprolyl isomerase, partial [Candidatus Sumerlaeia bacterium]|nr:peptidylprolyl isomerase [Candidatus Sumerlaeia bacterium]
ALYEDRREEFAQPERVRVRIVLLEGLDEAEEVLQLLEEGADFRRLAQERSIHESRIEGGELEEFRRGTFNEDFEEAAFSLDPGELTLVTTGAGTFVMEKVSHVAASYTPFDQVRPLLVDELQTQRRELVLQQVQRASASH